MDENARPSLAERVASRLSLPQPAPPQAPSPAEPAIPAAPRPVLNVDLDRLRAEGCITPGAPSSCLNQELRAIKRQLLARAFPHGGAPSGNRHLIMVTSPSVGEGKTFVTLNLALSLSFERDIRVLVVDADCYAHAASERLGCHQATGLVDLLAQPDLNLRDVMMRTSIPNLTFLPSGQWHPHATELLASRQMGRLMGEVASRYSDRVVLIDTPPVLAGSEAPLLAGHVGQTLVLVEKDRTSRQALEKALDLLQGCTNVSCIFNMATDDVGIPLYEFHDHGRA